MSIVGSYSLIRRTAGWIRLRSSRHRRPPACVAAKMATLATEVSSTRPELAGSAPGRSEHGGEGSEAASTRPGVLFGLAQICGLMA